MSRRSAPLILVLALSALSSGCGDEPTGKQATKTASEEYIGDLPPGVTDEPSADLVAEWPERWCRVRIGTSRVRVAELMGAVPTTADSQQIPLIPPVQLNSRGENQNEGPPMAAGSDTWVAVGSYKFNAFYDQYLRVQQLDFSGPQQGLPCPSIRIRN